MTLFDFWMIKSDALSSLFIRILALGALSLTTLRSPYCEQATPCGEAMEKGLVISPRL